jgi:hypothetical protein
MSYQKDGATIDLLGGPKPVRLLYPRYQVSPGSQSTANRFENSLIAPGAVTVLIYPKFGDMGDGPGFGWHGISINNGSLTISAYTVSWTAYALIFYHG